MKFVFLCICCMSFFIFPTLVFSEVQASSRAKVFSLTSEEMLFASKLSDANRRRFCYQFSMKERNLAMQTVDSNLSADARVEDVFSSLYAPLEPKACTR